MTSTYNLELTEDELTVLWALCQLAELDRGKSKRIFVKVNRSLDRVDGAIETVTRKVNELMQTPSLDHTEPTGPGGAL